MLLNVSAKEIRYFIAYGFKLGLYFLQLIRRHLGRASAYAHAGYYFVGIVPYGHGYANNVLLKLAVIR